MNGQNPMAIIARDGTILDANHAASELFAWPHAEFLGMNILSRRPRPLPGAGRAGRVRPRLLISRPRCGSDCCDGPNSPKESKPFAEPFHREDCGERRRLLARGSTFFAQVRSPGRH